MASYTARTNKAGEVVSYQIKVSRGRDKLTGKQNTPFTTTYTPPEGWSKKAVQRDLIRFIGEFETACKRGEVLTREQEKEKALEQLEQEKQEKEDEERKPTFKKYIEIYLKERETVLAYNTLHRYDIALNRAVFFLGDYKLYDIDLLMIKKYFTELQTGNYNKKTGGKLSHATILSDYEALHMFFQNAVENGVIDNNPMINMKAPKRPKDEIKKDALVYDEKQVAYIMECLNKEKLKWKAFVLFAIDTGCRRGEIVGLRWSDIDFKTGKVEISRNAQSAPGKGVYITTPKSRKSRIIFMNAPVITIMQTLKKEQALLNFRLGRASSGFCFTKLDGDMMNPQEPTQFLRKFGKRYNLPGIHPHALRHTMATISIANGADIVSVSKKLGHSTPAITLNVYSHANEEAQKRTNDILAEAIYTDEKKAN